MEALDIFSPSAWHFGNCSFEVQRRWVLHSAVSIFAAAQSHNHSRNLHLLMTHAYSISVQPIISMHICIFRWVLGSGEALAATYLAGSSWLSAHRHKRGPSVAVARGAGASIGAAAGDPLDWLSPHLWDRVASSRRPSSICLHRICNGEMEMDMVKQLEYMGSFTATA